MSITQEEKRVLLAEAEGWTCAEHVAEFDKPFALMCWHPPGGQPWNPKEPPDYFNDLNAVSHLEEKILRTDGDAYIDRLKAERGTLWGFASAAQRAEALGKTLNLW